jgi:putative beta-barrel porin BBP2
VKAFRFVVLTSAMVVAGGPGRLFAQEIQDPDAARFRLGPLRFTPSIALTSLGVDTNVFNDVDNPRQDSTAAVSPAVDLIMRVGPSRLTGRVNGQYLYFDKYSNQRAWNTTYDARWELPMARLTPYFEGQYADTKSRPGYEIDSRLRLRTQDAAIGTELRVSARATLVMSGRRSRVDFADDQLVGDTDVSQALNSESNTEQLKLRYRLTSLTTFVVDAQAIQDRFSFEPVRNANSIKVQPGFELRPAALISGRVFVGMRRFSPLNAAVPGYTGPTASVSAKLTARATQFGALVTRDVVYSYQETRPYYLLTDAGVTITQRLSYTWDVVGRGSQQLLQYRSFLPAPGVAVDNGAVSLLPLHEKIQSVGLGVGYRFGKSLRLGLDAIYIQRRSSDPTIRDYKGMRAGLSASYGLSQ